MSCVVENETGDTYRIPYNNNLHAIIILKPCVTSLIIWWFVFIYEKELLAANANQTPIVNDAGVRLIDTQLIRPWTDYEQFGQCALETLNQMIFLSVFQVSRIVLWKLLLNRISTTLNLTPSFENGFLKSMIISDKQTRRW